MFRYKDNVCVGDYARHLISVDPGLRTFAFAVWKGDELRHAETVNIRSSLSKEEKPEDEGLELGLALQNLRAQAQARLMIATSGRKGFVSSPDKIGMVVELPALFGGAGGRMVAARGDLVKLTLAAGIIHGIGQELGLPGVFVSPMAWKGQLGKKLITSRLRKILPEAEKYATTDHAWDAIGIGLFARGLFKNGMVVDE